MPKTADKDEILAQAQNRLYALANEVGLNPARRVEIMAIHALIGDAVYAAMPKSTEAASAMLFALDEAAPWLGKMIADGSHLRAVAPRRCENALELVTAARAQAEAAGIKVPS